VTADLLRRAAVRAQEDPDPRWHPVGEWLAETAIRWDWVEERDLAAAVARALLGESA